MWRGHLLARRDFNISTDDLSPPLVGIKKILNHIHEEGSVLSFTYQDTL